jgi:hypothetical protein
MGPESSLPLSPAPGACATNAMQLLPSRATRAVAARRSVQRGIIAQNLGIPPESDSWSSLFKS